MTDGGSLAAVARNHLPGELDHVAHAARRCRSLRRNAWPPRSHELRVGPGHAFLERRVAPDLECDADAERRGPLAHLLGRLQPLGGIGDSRARARTFRASSASGSFQTAT